MSLVQSQPKKIYIRVNEGPAPADVTYNFPASDLSGGTYPGWTLLIGGFAQGSLGTDWTTVIRSNTSCVMYRSAPSGNFKMQHRMGYYNAEWGGTSRTGVNTQTKWEAGNRVWETGTYFRYWSTTAGGYNSGSKIVIDGTVQGVTVSQLQSGTIFIDEIEYNNGVYTVSLYEDDNGEPGAQLYTASASGPAPDVLYVYHEVGTGTATQTNRVKIWNL